MKRSSFFFAFLLCLASALFLPYGANAQTPLADPERENRAIRIISDLQCLVCEGQPLSQSQAPLARDLRAFIREKVAEGESEEEILRFLSEKYGRAILLKPPLHNNTFLLWSAPLLALALGVFLTWRFFDRSRERRNP